MTFAPTLLSYEESTWDLPYPPGKVNFLYANPERQFSSTAISLHKSLEKHIHIFSTTSVDSVFSKYTLDNLIQTNPHDVNIMGN